MADRQVSNTGFPPAQSQCLESSNGAMRQDQSIKSLPTRASQAFPQTMDEGCSSTSPASDRSITNELENARCEWFIEGQLVPNDQVVRQHPTYVPFETCMAKNTFGFQGQSSYPSAGSGGGYLAPCDWKIQRPIGAEANQTFEYIEGRGFVPCKGEAIEPKSQEPCFRGSGHALFKDAAE